MYWFKLKSFFPVCVGAILLAACKPEIKDTGAQKYFDLKGYFKSEIVRLNQLHPMVTKTVTYNNDAETKQVSIKSWAHELDLFAESDINKPSWKDNYRINTQGNTTTYIATDDKLRTRGIRVVKNGNKLILIDISNFTENLLYKSNEHLVYAPDSVYRIEKQQTVKILGTNTYQIYGKFK